MNNTFTEENYLKTIYHLQQSSGTVSTNDLAFSLNTSPASITDMLKKLSRKKLISYKAYYGCSLTAKGENTALAIIRRHRLWEYFLSQTLGFGWDEVHEIAEDLEHISNEKLINKLDEFLNFPQTDPHGDPIPDARGRMSKQLQISLFNLQEKKVAIVTQIANQSTQVLELLEKKNIHIGTHIEVLQRFPFDESMEIKTDKKHLSNITKELSKIILLKTNGQASFRNFT
ncbi:MAG TPA: metal-dependent transcriptional regulator [Niabella sp.]|nr:metal-dependent transcriptional regulator [Niabella sp.]HOZ96671.1 metal-dependent transcriptional regulator [Niabella sp.]HQW14461.1 metal-dependent transcriptional regulator [Niabella sp.]HQX19876.1 metal-dependent transcriptional regulator [Niabella sp.]HQX40665.1 metal-dependent transcriptional regulator [Niabella sp.]